MNTTMTTIKNPKPNPKRETAKEVMLCGTDSRNGFAPFRLLICPQLPGKENVSAS